MDRQTDSRSGGVPERSGNSRSFGVADFKLLLFAYGAILGQNLLSLGISYAMSCTPLWYELCITDKYGMPGRLLYFAVSCALQCLLLAPLIVTAASLVYRGVNGIKAKGISGFFGARAWLRAAALCLPCTALGHLLYDVFYPFSSIGSKAGWFIGLVVTMGLYCVYYGYAACVPVKKAAIGELYKAGLKMAVSHPVRLILTAVSCTAAEYLIYTLPITALQNNVLWKERGIFYVNAELPVLDHRILTSISVILLALSRLVYILIFYLVMLPRKKSSAAAENSGDLTGTELSADKP